MSTQQPSLEIVYCHGLPGSVKEIESLIPEGCAAPSFLGPLDLEGFDKWLGNTGRKDVHLIGFSLGALTAIKAAARHSDAVKKVTLIAPAAPLELGDFLPRMAGRPVFKAAKSGDILFSAFTTAQRLGVAMAPEKIITAMFEDSPAADKDLLADPDFKRALISGLKQSLGQDRRAYHKAI